eukprot:Rmarinus@m.7998
MKKNEKPTLPAIPHPPDLEQLRVEFMQYMHHKWGVERHAWEIIARFTGCILGYLTCSYYMEDLGWYWLLLAWFACGLSLFGLRCIVSSSVTSSSATIRAIGLVSSVPLLLPLDRPTLQTLKNIRESKTWFSAGLYHWRHSLALTAQGRRVEILQALLIWTIALGALPLIFCKFGIWPPCKYYVFPLILAHTIYGAVLKLKWLAGDLEFSFEETSRRLRQMSVPSRQKIAEMFQMVRVPQSGGQMEAMYSMYLRTDEYLQRLQQAMPTPVKFMETVFGYNSMNDACHVALENAMRAMNVVGNSPRKFSSSTDCALPAHVPSTEQATSDSLPPSSTATSSVKRRNLSSDRKGDKHDELATSAGQVTEYDVDSMSEWVWRDSNQVGWDAQPACFLTDYVLAVECFLWAYLLHNLEALPWHAAAAVDNHPDAPVIGATAAVWYSLYFVGVGASALFGAILHHVAYVALLVNNKNAKGAKVTWHERVISLLWAGVQLSAAFSNFALFGVYAASLESETNQINVIYGAGVVYVLYGAYSVIQRQTILLTLGFIPPLLALGYSFVVHLPFGCGWAAHGLSSLLLVIFGGVTQFLQVSPCNQTFNHNAAGHIVLMFAFTYMFLSAYRQCFLPPIDLEDPSS